MDVTAPEGGPQRRALIAAPCVVGAAALLAACAGREGSGDDGSGGSGEQAQPPASPTGTPAGPSDPPPTSPAGATGAGAPLAKVSDIPVGGGKVFGAQGVVVTQPEAGIIRAFAAACTHQGCSVTKVDTTINCVCHNSRFDLADGSVVGGPAPRGLPPVPIRVTGDTITLA